MTLRIYCRTAFGANRLGLDDAITVLCLALALAACIVMTLSSTHGLGGHAGTLSRDELDTALWWNGATGSVLVWVFTVPKFAIIAILQRILQYGRRTSAVFWVLCLTCQAGIIAASVVWQWWYHGCRPVGRGPDDVAVPSTCAEPSRVLTELGYVVSVYSALLDILFAFYPVPFIMRLNMSWKSRVAVSVAMGLTSLGFAVSVYKLIIFGEIFQILATDPICMLSSCHHGAPVRHSANPAVVPAPYLNFLGFTEACILVVCASLPTLGPLYKLVGKRLGGSHVAHSPGGTGGSSEAIVANRNRAPGWKCPLENTIAERGEGGLKGTDEIPLVSQPACTTRWRASGEP